ncbi:MAG: hypothetical protein U9Q92_06180 [archaeon]|nr:hypothetical protein [archaeon]
MNGYDSCGTFREACDFYLARLLDVGKIPRGDIEEGMAFFDDLYNNPGNSEITVYPLSKHRSCFMTRTAIDALNRVQDVRGGQASNQIVLESLPECLPKKPYYVLSSTASGETNVVIDGLNRLKESGNADAHLLLLIGEKNSTVYRIAEEIADNNGNVAIIHYESSSKLNDTGSEFDSLGSVFEQQIQTILTGTGCGGMHDDYSSYTEVMNKFASDITELKGIDNTPLENMINSYSDALGKKRKIYVGGEGPTLWLVNALQRRMNHIGMDAEVVNGKDEYDVGGAYIPFTGSGMKYHEGAAGVASVHPVVPDCVEIHSIRNITSSDNILKIPFGDNSDHLDYVPPALGYWYKAHLLNDAALATAQREHKIKNDALRSRHEKDSRLL